MSGGRRKRRGAFYPSLRRPIKMKFICERHDAAGLRLVG
jgi:hypothetical protein